MNRFEVMHQDLVKMLRSPEECKGWAEQELGPYQRDREPVPRKLIRREPSSCRARRSCEAVR